MIRTKSVIEKVLANLPSDVLKGALSGLSYRERLQLSELLEVPIEHTLTPEQIQRFMRDR